MRHNPQSRSDTPHVFYFLSMSHLPGGRKTRAYNAQERAAIDPFKDNYLSATSAAARKVIAQNLIFPALWNHWASIGQVLDDAETRLRTEVICIHYKISLLALFCLTKKIFH